MARAASFQGNVPPLDERTTQQFGLTATLEVMVPVFGGGVRHDPDEQRRQVKEIDPVTPVRPASLRGQLRAWWRRTCGTADGRPLPLEVLRSREALLWGWAGGASGSGRGWVALAVDSSRLTRKQEPVFTLDHRKKWSAAGDNRALQYGAFPLMPKNQDGNLEAGKLTRLTGGFEVRLAADRPTAGWYEQAERAWGRPVTPEALWAEVVRAFDAWCLLGGIGGRTRRGFGAVRRTDAAPAVDLRTLCRELGWALAVRPVDRPSPDGAWRDGLERLQRFRQGPGVGRNTGQEPNRPGRSRWPEADLIRRIARKNSHQHKPEHGVQKAPRAAFGLPIVFHFKDRDDPQDHILRPKDMERFASPLLLRPVKDHAGFRSAAVVIPPREGWAWLSHLQLGHEHVSGALTADEAVVTMPIRENRSSRSPLEPVPALAAFLEFFLK
jgi:CRISPR-associated protein Cmr1